MWKVYVGNLDSRVKERELADEFRSYGNVRSVWVARNPPGYAFVEFDDRRDAEDSVSALDVLENKAVMERKPPPLECVIVAHVGKHGWRVEMSRKSVGGGGRSRASHGNESRCYDCGGVGHFARECRSRGSRYSRRRSPSPLSRRSDSHRHSLSRSGRDGSRSPRRDRSNSYRDRSSPRRKRERSRSLDSDISEGRGHRAKGRRHSISPQHGKSDALSPRREDNELSRSPQNDPETKEHELSRSPQNGGSDTREASLGVKGDEGSKSPPSERSGQLGDLQKEGYEPNGTPQGEESDMEGDGSPVLRDDSRSPRPDNADGPIRNGSAGGRSPQEDNNTSYPDRSPAEELVEEHCNGDSD